MKVKEKILIIEDNKKISELIEICLGNRYEILTTETGEDGLLLVEKYEIDLIILDIVLPKMDGLAVLTEIRKSYQVPVIIVSSKDLDMDIILGLKMGADDYITKPFNVMELEARVEAQLRRRTLEEEKEEEEFTQGRDLRLYHSDLVVYQGEKEITLLPTEYKILKMLMENPGRVFTKKQIYEEVWEEEYAYDDNTVMVHISKLREKLQKSEKDQYIKTIRGLGYRFEK